MVPLKAGRTHLLSFQKLLLSVLHHLLLLGLRYLAETHFFVLPPEKRETLYRTEQVYIMPYRTPRGWYICIPVRISR